MKFGCFYNFLASAFITLVVTGSAEAATPRQPRRAIGDSCSRVVTLPGAFVYKTVGSSHFSPSDCRRHSVGLILKFGARGFNTRGVDILGVNGTVLAKMGYYGRWVGGPARFYQCIGYGRGGAINGRSLASRAQRALRSKNIYLKFAGPRRGVCYGPIAADRCYNTVNC